MNLNRSLAIVLRHLFMARHQLDRVADLFLFPILAIFLWGFFSKFSGLSDNYVLTYLIGGIILWTIFERVGSGIGIDFMYDVWEKTIMNFLASPIKISEYVFGIAVVSLIKVAISFVAMWLISAVFFGFNLDSLGSSLVFLWINIVIFAISFGIFNVALVIRYGATIGPLTWILPFLLQPFVAVFYPVSILPLLLQRVVWFLPLSHVFEGMRYVISNGKLDVGNFMIALGLNVIYFILSILFFAYMFNSVKKKGTLVKL